LRFNLDGSNGNFVGARTVLGDVRMVLAGMSLILDVKLEGYHG